jgi:hypothetical protein
VGAAKAQALASKPSARDPGEGLTKKTYDRDMVARAIEGNPSALSRACLIRPRSLKGIILVVQV